MVAVILVSRGLVINGLESLLKASGWTPHRLRGADQDDGLDAQLKSALAASPEHNPSPHTALIAAVDLVEAHRTVEQVLGQCSRVRVVMVAPDSMDRDSRRAVVRDGAQHPGGRPGGDRERWDVVGDDAVGPDHAALADRHAARHDDVRAEPDVVADPRRPLRREALERHRPVAIVEAAMS